MSNEGLYMLRSFQYTERSSPGQALTRPTKKIRRLFKRLKKYYRLCYSNVYILVAGLDGISVESSPSDSNTT